MKREMTEAIAKWRGLISEQVQSKKSAAVFCRERGLKPWQFYEWKKRLREAEAKKFVEVRIAAPVRPAQLAKARSSAIEIRLREGRSLMVEPGFDASHLRALLDVLEPRA